MFIEKIDPLNKQLFVSIPLTASSGKARIKKRASITEYGNPIASRQVPLDTNCYIEWQIGYDVPTNELDKLKLSTLQNFLFIGANGKEKTLYELSEYVYYFYNWGIISKQNLLDIATELKAISPSQLIDTDPNLQILRTEFKSEILSNINFEISQVKYPLLIHNFSYQEIIAEIVIKEKQRAVGIQPMLYICIPINILQPTNGSLIGRTTEQKEVAHFIINKDNIFICLQMLKIFGILSKNHNHDILEIINRIIK